MSNNIVDINSLITPYEVVRYSPAWEGYSTDNVCTNIKRVERNCFKKCYLGLELYNNLKNDLLITSVPENYDSDIEYNVGDLICYDGCFYQSTIDNNDVNPDDIDLENPQWVKPSKFKTECNNILWCEYLREFLALKVLKSSVKYSTFRATNKGAGKVKDENFTPLTLQELNAFKRCLENDAQEVLECMFDYLVDKTNSNKCACDYRYIPKVNDVCGCKDVCVEPIKRKVRRIAFNVSKPNRHRW